MRTKPSKYLLVLPKLKKLWAVSNFSCGQLLVPTIPSLLESLLRFDEIQVNRLERKLLLKVSSATVDRLLKADRKRLEIKGRSGTKPGPLFKILGIDSDNDALFINWHFMRMTKRKEITFTRSRAYRKNDQAHIEQKNWSTVRKIVGYRRLETEKQLEILNQAYKLLSDYLNFFIPTLKLLRKESLGSKVKRIYDKPKTPYQRVLEHPGIDEITKDQLRSKYQTLNPAALLREINRLVRELMKP